jgi:L-threonylcarbamoyladenylate synthase
MPARTATEVASFFPSGLDLIVDAGPAPGGKPSTVLDVSNDEARVIREGAVSIYELKETLDSIGAKWNE